MHDIDLQAPLGCLSQTICNERVIFAQRRTDDQRTLQTGYISDFHAKPTRAHCRAIGACIRLAQTRIDAGGTQCAHQFVKQVQLFQRLMRRSQCGD